MYSKYRNIITEVDGIKFRSKKEAKRYCELSLLKKHGHIIDFKMQVPYVIASANGKTKKYYADFVVTWGTHTTTVEDCKGVKTDLYELKKMLMKEKHGIDVVEI